MQAKVECNPKFKKYYDNKIMYDELYFDIVPCNIVIYFRGPRFDLIIRCDWNTQIDRQVDMHLVKTCHEKGSLDL